MIQRLKKPVKPLWYLLALVIIISALLLQVVRLLVPTIDNYRSTIEEIASEQLNADVTVSSISGSWYGLRPEIIVSDLSIQDDSDHPVLSARYARMQLNILASLTHWMPVLDRLEIQGLNLSVEQGKEGGWSVGGLSAARNEGDWQYRDPGALFLMAKQVDIDTATIRLLFHNDRQLISSVPQIVIQNDGHFHRLNVEATIEDDSRLTFVLEGIGDPALSDEFSANAYLQLKQFPLERFVTYFSQMPQVDDLDITQGSRMDLDLWFDFTSPSRFLLDGHLDLFIHQPSEFAKENFLDIPLSTDISGDYSIDKGLTLGLRNTNIDRTLTIAPASINLHSDKLTVGLERFDFEPWLRWLNQRLIHQENVREVLNTLAPRGQLTNIRATIDLMEMANSYLQANVLAAATNSWKNVPSFKQVNGYVESSMRHGFVLLDSEDFQLHPQSVYELPLVFSQARGYVGWKLAPEDNEIVIYSNDLVVNGDFGQGKGYFGLTIPWIQGSYNSELVLQIGLKNSDASYYPQFLPDAFPDELRQWMDGAIKAGSIPQAGFIYRGGFQGAINRSIQFFGDIEQAQLDQDDWPLLNNIDTRLVVDNNRLDARITAASFYEGDKLSGTVSWNKKGKKYLYIDAAGDTQASSALRFLQNSWLADKTGGLFDDWIGSGDLQVAAEIAVPILDPDVDPETNVKVNFANNNIKLKQQRLVLQNIRGEFIYSSTAGFDSRNLMVDLFKQPVQLQFGGGANGDEALLLQGKGVVSIDALADWTQQPLTAFMAGEFDYDIDLTIPLSPTENNKPKAELYSSMRGVTVDLPEPLGKPEGVQRSVSLTVDLDPQHLDYHFRFGDNLAGFVVHHHNRPVQLVVNLSDKEVSMPERAVEEGGYINADFSTLDLKPWLDYLNQFERSPGNETEPLLFGFALTADRLTYGKTLLEGLTFSGGRQARSWTIDLNSDFIQGNVQFFDDDQPAVIALKQLQLAELMKNPGDKDTAETDPLAAIDPSKIKPATVTIEQLLYKERDFGRWEFDLWADKQGIELRKLSATIADLTLSGREGQQGAYLRWQFPTLHNPMSTSFIGHLRGNNLKTLFEQLGSTPVLESKETDIMMNFNWPGSPAAFGVESLKGRFSFAFKDGLFIQEDNNTTGILKLLGLMNFDTWARRIRLDFSDLYKQGLVFDDLQGELLFEDGQISTEQSIIAEGPSSKLSLAGTADYVNERVDGELLATLPIGGNLTVATALAAGLPAAAGVYIVSKLFKRQVDKVSSIRYNISGSWDDPVIKVMNPETNNNQATQSGEQEIQEVGS